MKNITRDSNLITDEIFVQLKLVDRSLTENEFNTRYLRTSRSYLSNRRNKKRDVSNDVLLNLYAELSGVCDLWHLAATNEADKTRKDRWTQMAEFHSGLADQVVRQLIERARASKKKGRLF